MKSRELVGENLRRIRKQLGWTQEKLSVRSHVDEGYICTLEHAQVNVSVDTLDRLAKALGVETSEFFSTSKG